MNGSTDINYKALIYNSLSLKQTCCACPEQYDVYANGKQVGYLRLRHGVFTAQIDDASGEIIYEAYPEGDGIFNDNEREYYLINAKIAIVNKLYEF